MITAKSFDEIKMGEKEFFSKTFTEADLGLYSGITGDFNPLHMDVEYAKQSRFGERVVHGILVVGLASSVLGMKLPGIGTIILDMTFRFIAPVKIGDTITVEAKVVDKIERKKFVKFDTIFRNQKGEEVIKGDTLV